MDRQAYLTDPSRRPRSSHKVVVTTPAMEHQEFLLRKHAVLRTAATVQQAASPMAVGRAIEELIHTLPHLLRITSHDSEDFLVHFQLLAHNENAVHCGVIKVDCIEFTVKG